MFSKILIKLIDEAVLPAVALIAARVVSVILIGNYFNVKYSLGASGFVFSDSADYILINSYSTFTMVVFLAVGLLYILLKSLLFHETHITPHLTARLFSLRLSSLIQTSFDVYSQGIVWLSYLYLLLIVSAIFAFSGFLYSWVFFVALVLTVVATYFFILDIENEIYFNSEPAASAHEDVLLTLGSIDEL